MEKMKHLHKDGHGHVVDCNIVFFYKSKYFFSAFFEIPFGEPSYRSVIPTNLQQHLPLLEGIFYLFRTNKNSISSNGKTYNQGNNLDDLDKPSTAIDIALLYAVLL